MHARISCKDGAFFLTDLQSEHGTWIAEYVGEITPPFCLCSFIERVMKDITLFPFAVMKGSAIGCLQTFLLVSVHQTLLSLVLIGR